MSTTAAVPDVKTAMPDLALVDAAGTATSLSAVRGAGPSIVYFLRASDCPVCIAHARKLARLAESNQLRGASVVLVAPGSAPEAARLAGRVPSSAVSTWASGTAHPAAGLGTFLSLQHSGTFLLNADGTIRYRRTATLPPRSLDLAELLVALDRPKDS